MGCYCSRTDNLGFYAANGPNGRHYRPKESSSMGLVLFGGGSVFTAFAPTFGLLIVARNFRAVGIPWDSQ
ncbi:MAG: hypothetical protein Ct9H300mP19_05890 [Dehalococcoidia bacterium]|nr:MAG: hypothetical protein Ct9H300mP19_05890 [Dehalococcoidia bacterium]